MPREIMEEKKRQSNGINGLQFIKQMLRPFWKEVIAMVVVAILWSIDFSLRPYLVKIILDRLSTTSSINIINRLIPPIIVYLGATLSVVLTYRCYDLLKMRLIPALKKLIISYLMNHVMGQSHRFFQNNFAGDLANRIKEVARGVSEMVEISIERFFSHGLALIIAIATIIYVQPILGFVMAAWIIIYLVVSLKSAHIIRELSFAQSQAQTKVIGNIVDIVANMMTVRLFAGRQHEQDNIDHWTDNAVVKERALDWFLFKLWLFQGLLFVVVLSISCFFLVVGRQHGYITIGDFGLILTINIYITECLWNLAKDVGKFSEYWGLVNQGLRIAYTPYDMKDIADAKDLLVTKGKILFDGVTFAYKVMNPLFNNLKITIEAGQKVGLVGSSGSGKTTFIYLILRLFDIQAGKIYIDDQDISQVKQDSLRRFISMIPQDPTLLHRALIENIRYGSFKASDQEVFVATQKAYAADFINHLSHGYATLVGERGAKLSGGQRQRIAIARAILKDVPILIFDEATSALDSITEQHIQESFLELMHNRTTIVIAHRLSTLLRMDRILVFDHGNIVEDGTHQQLLRNDGAYRRLWNAQVGGFLPDEEDQEQEE